MFNNKHGSVRDVVLIAVVLFGLSVGVFTVHYMLNTSVDTMLNNTQINQSSSAVSSFQSLKNVSQRFDYIIFGVFVGMILALMIASWFVGGNPIFMGIYFLIVIIMTSVSAIMANIWDDVAQASVFGGNVVNFPITNHILSYFPLYMAAIGLLGLLIMFAKPFLSDGGY